MEKQSSTDYDVDNDSDTDDDTGDGNKEIYLTDGLRRKEIYLNDGDNADKSWRILEAADFNEIGMISQNSKWDNNAWISQFRIIRAPSKLQT